MPVANKEAHPFYARMAAIDARVKIHWRPSTNRRGGGFEYPSGDRYIIDKRTGAFRRQPRATQEELQEPSE